MKKTEEIEKKPPATEDHYSVSEVAQQTHWSDNTTRAMFKEEPGVKTRTVNGRTSMRIPKSVIDRVMRRMANPGAAA